MLHRNYKIVILQENQTYKQQITPWILELNRNAQKNNIPLKITKVYGYYMKFKIWDIAPLLIWQQLQGLWIILFFSILYKVLPNNTLSLQYQP